MIETKINSIRVKDFEKYSCPDLNFENDCPVLKFEIKGDGTGYEEQRDNKANKKALEEYKKYLFEQNKLVSLYLNNIDTINQKSELYFGKVKYKTC
jgi:hypothetical protein